MKLEIRLDRPDGVYLAGDTVSGVVVVHDPDGGRGNLQLVREWRAHGRGSGDYGSRAETTLAESWGAGTSEIPFSIPMPDGPFTYRGTNTNLDWYIRAEAGALFKIKAETDLIYGAVPNMPNVDFGPSYALPSLPKAGKVNTTVVSPALAIGGGVAFMGFVAGIMWLADIPFFIIAIIGVIIGGSLATAIYSLIRNSLAGQKLGDVKVSIEPLVVQPNNNVQIRFETVVKADLELEKIEVGLIQYEFYASGSGTSRTTKTVPIQTLAVPVSESRHLRAGEKLEFAFELPIPDGAATTFSARDNKVFWQVVITLPIKGWSDWQHLQDITVRP